MYKKYLKNLKKEYKNYNSKAFTKDLIAGFSVAAVSLPLALAFAMSSGGSASSGLISAIIAGLVVAGLSNSSYQISGPTGTMTAILLLMSARFGMIGIFMSCLVAGITLVIAGVLKLGKLVAFIPTSVISGFSSGIAIIIASSQIDNLFKVTSSGSSVLERMLSYIENGFNFNWTTLLFGILAIAIMVLWPKKYNKVLPSSLLAIIVCLCVNLFLKLDINVVGNIPATLIPDARLTLSNIPWSHLSEFIMPGVSIAALIMIESLLCGSSASKMKKEKFDGTQELIAQGVGNVVIPFLGGVPVTAALARTSVAIKSGSVTRLTSVIHSIVLIISMFVLRDYLALIPLSSLSGVLIVTAFRMNDWEHIKYMFNVKFKVSLVQFFATMIATVVFDLTSAIVIGMLVSMILFVVRHSDLEITVSKIDSNRIKNLTKDVTNVKLVYITGPLFFGNQKQLKSALDKISKKDTVILSMRGVPSIDGSAVIELTNIIEEYKIDNHRIILCGLQKKVKNSISKAMGNKHEIEMYWDAIDAIDNL